MPRQGVTTWLLIPALLGLVAVCLPWDEGSARANLWVLGAVGVALAAGAVWHLVQQQQARSEPNEGSVLELRETLRLSDKHRLHAVRFRSTLLLLSETTGALKVLDAATLDGHTLPSGPSASGDGGVDLKDTPAQDGAREARRSVAELIERGEPSTSRSAVAAASMAEFKDRLERARGRA